MAIKYKISKRAQPGVKGGGKKKYCAIPYQRGMIEFRELAEDISESTSLHEADVYSALRAFTKTIMKHIQAGASVRLDDFGIFSVSFRSEMMDKKEDVNSKTIKELRLNFRPDVRIKEKLQHAEFEKEYVRKKK
jgi:predicted histone-like DNA-binding protein